MDTEKILEGYFRDRDLKKIREYREKVQKELKVKEKEALKKLHYMHCPKCGAKMETIKMAEIEIDKCPDCLGLYFDNHELEQLLDFEFKKRRTVFHKLFGLE